ncbi:hypothetical protein HRbin08_00733 [bacterium HR08]|nr:hypothetical protein HRbin08_00733 [bacterium HR08]
MKWRSALPRAFPQKGVGLRSRRAYMALGTAFAFVVPSLGQVQKYAGMWGMLFYVLLAFGFWSVAPRFLRKVDALVPERWACGLALATGFVLLILFFALYPIADAGIIGGGSDRDDALNLGVRELLRGRCPYHVTTYLGNPIAPLPGGLLLSLPFVVLGNSAYQNFFWLAVFFLVAREVLGDSWRALLLLWSLLLFSPVLLQQIVTGGDLPANSIAVLTFCWLSLRASPRWRPIVASLLGLAWAWRMNFMLLIPLVTVLLNREIGRRSALELVGLASGVLVGVTLPFALHDPHGLSPFLMQNKFARFDGVLAHADLLLPLATGGYALACARAQADASALFRSGALVLAFPILSGLTLATIQAGRLDLSLAEYGVSFLFFGVLAAWMWWVHAPSPEEPIVSEGRLSAQTNRS